MHRFYQQLSLPTRVPPRESSASKKKQDVEFEESKRGNGGPLDAMPPQANKTPMAEHSLQYLTANDWTLIAARAERKVFSLGQEIIREGVRGESIFIIRHGVASVELIGSHGSALLARLREGDVCGDMAFIEGGAATASVIARDGDVETDEIRTKDLRDLFGTFPGLASRFYQSLAAVLACRLRDTSRELMRILDARKV